MNYTMERNLYFLHNAFSRFIFLVNEYGHELFFVVFEGHPVRRYQKIRDSDPSHIFNVDPITGDVSLNVRQDYENPQDKVWCIISLFIIFIL